MRSALAIYITLSAVAVVAIAQILYWKLVINRESGAGDLAPDSPDMVWLETVDTWAEFEADAVEPVELIEPGLVSEPVLLGA